MAALGIIAFGGARMFSSLFQEIRMNQITEII